MQAAPLSWKAITVFLYNQIVLQILCISSTIENVCRSTSMVSLADGIVFRRKPEMPIQSKQITS